MPNRPNSSSHRDASSTSATTSNLAPELLVWRRLRQGALPSPLERHAAELDERKGQGRTLDAWKGAGHHGPSSEDVDTEEDEESTHTSIAKKSGGGGGAKKKTKGHGYTDGAELQKLSSWVPATAKLPWKERIRHFTWTWFTMTMATGGIASVFWHVPIRFQALYGLGCIFAILNMVLFIFNVTMISLRFYFFPATFKSSFVHPTESLFIPAAIISVGTILINISQYGVGTKTGGWLDDTMIVLFWIYCALAVSLSCGIYLIMWSTQTFTISQMTPIWIFPAYPLLVTGPHASVIASKVPPERAMTILIGGFVIQGTGFMVSLMVYAAFLYRLMTQKLPKESLRPGMFISVGPSGFTISALLNMAAQLPRVVPPYFMGDGELTAKVSIIMANWVGLWLWGLAFFFFLVSVGAHTSVAAHGRVNFSMTWYSFVFPNTALTNATFAVAMALGNNYPIQVLGCVMTCFLVVTWIFVFGMMIRAVVVKQILWPQRQEDRDEGGFRQQQVDVKHMLQDTEGGGAPGIDGEETVAEKSEVRGGGPAGDSEAVRQMEEKAKAKLEDSDDSTKTASGKESTESPEASQTTTAPIHSPVPDTAASPADTHSSPQPPTKPKPHAPSHTQTSPPSSSHIETTSRSRKPDMHISLPVPNLSTRPARPSNLSPNASNVLLELPPFTRPSTPEIEVSTPPDMSGGFVHPERRPRGGSVRERWHARHGVLRGEGGRKEGS